MDGVDKVVQSLKQCCFLIFEIREMDPSLYAKKIMLTVKHSFPFFKMSYFYNYMFIYVLKQYIKIQLCLVVSCYFLSLCPQVELATFFSETL